MSQEGVRRWLIACDESGVHGSPHYGFGSLWLKWQRRGDFVGHFWDLVEEYGIKRECKWSNATSMKYMAFYEDLIEYFFMHRWMVFHCLIVRRESVDKAKYHHNSWDLARRKNFTMLITDKIGRALRRFPDRDQEFRIYVDPIASSYEKADEAVEVISNNVLNQKFGKRNPVRSVTTRDSSNTPAIQLCDLLLGAVMETWQQKNTNKTREAIRDSIAGYLGWPALDSDTHRDERKFNIWYFIDTTREHRRVQTRPVNLVYPYPHGNID